MHFYEAVKNGKAKLCRDYNYCGNKLIVVSGNVLENKLFGLFSKDLYGDCCGVAIICEDTAGIPSSFHWRKNKPRFPVILSGCRKSARG